MYLLHFTSDDGNLTGEYVVLTEDSPKHKAQHAFKGYSLHTVCEVEGETHRLPTDTPLWRRS